MNGLLTDLYELTMAAGYFEAGKADEMATFEFAIRRLPPNRNYVLAAGLPQAVDYLLNLSFTAEEIDYLRGLAQFRRVSPAFFDYLRDFRFTGDLFAVPEGTAAVCRRADADRARAASSRRRSRKRTCFRRSRFQTLIASKAARTVAAAEGRAGDGIRHAPRAHARSRRAGRARRVPRRLRGHQQHAGRLPLRHPGNRARRRTPG